MPRLQSQNLNTIPARKISKKLSAKPAPKLDLKSLEPKTLFKRWEAFSEVAAPIFQPIGSEGEYKDTLALLDELTDRMETPNDARYLGLFRLLAERVVVWETLYEAPYFTDTPGHVTLKYLMQEHGVSQYQLEKEGIANQSLLSKILLGKRAVSKALAKKLGSRFKVSPLVFL
jgi:HTH-type transcriptional regulator / antitoxin HigA